MAGRSLQACADQEEANHRKSRLKIRRAFSSAAQEISPRIHGSCRKNSMIKEGCTTSKVAQPLIYRDVDPEPVEVEPAEFMSVVQELTGSPQTQKLQRVLKRRRSEMELRAQVRIAPERGSWVQKDPLKKGRIVVLAPAAVMPCSVNGDHACAKDSPMPSPACSNLSISHNPSLPAINQVNNGANPSASPSLSDTKQFSCSANHPANPPKVYSSISAKSATYAESSCAYRSPMSSSSPLSPHSSLTTSSEGTCFSMEEGGVSSYRRALVCLGEEEGSTVSMEEEGSFNFFVFSRDCYYGNQDHAAQGELDQFLDISNALDYLF